MAKKDFTLTLDRVRNTLEYDPITGFLKWKINRGRKAKKGAIAGNKHRTGYICLCISGKTFSAHRIIWLLVHGEWPKGDIDHINGIRDDNRIDNLRDVSPNINMQNKRNPQKNNTSGFIGVWKNGRNWGSKISVSGYSFYLGTYKTPQEAHNAYINAKRQIHPGNTL